ncbi:low-affinity Zn(2+) transporter zrt2 [Exophiala xenobiotica]|nr:low-affinity Zn(2+) transporter zrt2 [Exophiala xenobiotica]
MTIFVLFFVELMVMRYGNFTGGHSHDHSHADTELTSTSETFKDTPSASTLPAQPHSTTLGEDHLGHAREHNDIETANNPSSLEDYKAQMTAIFILEFGIIFHSVFIGLTLAVAGEEFDTLFIVIIFHQMFEGLGLGSRLAVAPWPKGRKWTPYLLGLAYGLSTPLAIAIGLGIRKSYPPGSQTTLIVNGVFDSISAGILIYTGLVELLAHEFLFQQNFANAKIQTVLSAFATMVCGAALMALLGKWA